ncbi:MAG: choice-of-anchor D domain-containing protein, partial [Candidatus Cloacimonadaceae bacterium]
MKKTTILFLLLMLIGIVAADTFTIGDGTSTQNYIPVYGFYNYGWSKTIYTAAELSASGFTPGEIAGLGYEVGNTVSNYVYENQQVYMRHTTVGSYAADDNLLPANTDFQNVFTGSVTFDGTGWHYIAFNSPFTWDGTSNIEITWENYDSTYASSYPNFCYTATTDDMAAYKYSDGSFPGDQTGSLTVNRPNLRIVTPSTNPPDPALLIAPANGGMSFADVTLSWSDGGGMPTSYNVYFGTSPSPTFVVNQPETSYALTDLLPATTYYWQIVPENAIGVALDCPVWSFSTPGADQLAESFEDSVPPPGWASIGVYSWSRSSSRSVHGDASAYRSGSSSNEYILSTPMLTIEAGSSLDFWAAGSNTTSGLEIVYSTDRDTWTQIGDAITHPGSYTFVNYNYDLSSLAGNSYYLGFRTTLVTGSSYLDAVIGPNILPIAPGAPVLDEPGDLDIDVNEYTIFEWDAPDTGGIPNHYNLYLDTVDGSTLFASEVMSPYTLDAPLSYETTYYWTVEAVNDAGTGPQAAVQSFTTRANPIVSTFPWTEDFGTTSSDTFPPLNWTRASGIFPIIDGTSSQWFRDDWLNGPSGNNAAKINIYGTGRKGWLITPPVDIPASVHELKFDLALMDYGNSNQIEFPEGQADDRFIVGMATNPNMTDVVILGEWNNTGSDLVFNQIPHTGTEITFSLSGHEGIRYFAFYGESTVSVTGEDNDLMVDNVMVRETPTSPLLTIDITEIDFGYVQQNLASDPQNLTLSNTGTGALNILADEFVITGTNAAMFSVDTSALPAALENGESVIIPVTANVTVEGPVTATLTVTNAQTGTNFEIALTANGMAEGLVIIGDGTANNNLPINAYWNYTYSQTIYPQADINTASQRIEKVYYYWDGRTAGVNSGGWTMYMGHTALSGFASTTDWVPVSQLTEVYSSDLIIPIEAGWVEVQLQTPFLYNNVDNLIIAVDENTPGNDGNGYYFHTTAASTPVSITYRSDSTNPDPVSPPTGTLVSAYPNVMLQFADLPTTPILAVSPVEWDFGNQVINTTHSHTFTISNLGAGTLSVGSVVVTGDAFSLAEPFTAVDLASAESTEFVVNYLPTVVGDHTGTAVVTAGDQSITVNLTGSCYDPIISTFPWTEDFGTEAADWMPVEWAQLTGLYPDGVTPSYNQWVQDDWVNVTDPVNKSAKINIYGSNRNGWLITPPINITAGAYELNFDLGLTRWNATTPVDPTQQLDDRFIVIMSTDAEMTNPVILREWNNSGSADVFNSISNTGENVTIPLTGVTGMFYLVFYGESTATGGDNDLFVDNVTVQESDLVETPEFAISPSSHDFGDVDINTTASQIFTVSNVGTGILTINSINLTGSNMMSLTGLPTLPADLAAAESFTFTAQYTPTGVGDHAATITIQDNVVRETHTVALTGTGAGQTPDDLYPPSNLHASVVGNDVHLGWEAPVPPPTGEWITWCNPAAL